VTKQKKKKTALKKQRSFKGPLQMTGVTDGNCNDIIREYKKCIERIFDATTCN